MCGFADRHTWVKNFYYDDAPLIFDEKYKRKESYIGVQNALKTLCPGGRVGEMMGGERAQCIWNKMWTRWKCLGKSVDATRTGGSCNWREK
jgi:hypothetical protein